MLSGGQSDGFLAFDDALKRWVFIKQERRIEPKELPRITEEGQALVSLRHPNLIQVYGHGEHEGKPYLVMEYVNGKNFQEAMLQDNLTLEAKVRILRDVTSALAEVHRSSMLHRDLKPSNILIDETNQKAVLIDLGLVQNLTQGIHVPSEEGGISGSPPYMSPEQARNEGVDIRSDIFSLGAILYHILVGHAPFLGHKPGMEGTLEALTKARNCAFDREKLLKTQNPRLLKEICLKAMEVDRNKRYSSAEELVQALDKFLSQSKNNKKNRYFFAAAIAGAALTFSGLYAMIPPAPPITPAVLKESQLGITVTRENIIYDLAKRLPLKNGDALQIRGVAPAKLKILLFWQDSQQMLHQLDVAHIPNRHEDPSLTHFVSPGEGLELPIVGQGGTEGILAVGDTTLPEKEHIGAILREAGKLSLASTTAIEITPFHIRPLTLRSPGAARPRNEPNWKVISSHLQNHFSARYPYFHLIFFSKE